MKRLRDRMREDLALRGMSVATIDSYVRCARKFAEHFGRSPRAMGMRQGRAFLLHPAGRGLSTSTLCVYGGALRFLYGVTLDRPHVLERLPRPRVPMRVPLVLSGTETERLLGAMSRANHRVALMLAYGAGLRVGEICRLRVDDIAAKRTVLRIRNAKHGRDRFVISARASCESSATGWRRVSWDRCCFRGMPGEFDSRAPSSKRRWPSPRGAPAFPSPARRIRSGTRSPPICSRPAPISARGKCSSGTRRSRARRVTRT